MNVVQLLQKKVNVPYKYSFPPLFFILVCEASLFPHGTSFGSSQNMYKIVKNI